ncbi:MAG: hypothetical protein LBP31_01035 [Holosporales bacterium]|nr:hypothetical protein [Holosporales bacterium]
MKKIRNVAAVLAFSVVSVGIPVAQGQQVTISGDRVLAGPVDDGVPATVAEIARYAMSLRVDLRSLFLFAITTSGSINTNGFCAREVLAMINSITQATVSKIAYNRNSRRIIITFEITQEQIVTVTLQQTDTGHIQLTNITPQLPLLPDPDRITPNPEDD